MRKGLVVVVMGLGLVTAPSAQALKLSPCAGQKGFDCGTLTVPLDRSGAVPGTVKLKLAVQDTAAARRKPGLLVALTGGPGQGGVSFAANAASTLSPLLKGYRLVTLDQRGTGGSGALVCRSIQSLSSLDAFEAGDIASCVKRIGARARAYTTQDTVADLDALREELKAPKLALMGVSYGTYVAQQYARVHPDTTDRLVLDSVVGPTGVDPFLIDSFAKLPRVLGEQCARSACRGITADPVADVKTLVGKLQAGSIAAPVRDAGGKARVASFDTGEQLFFALIAGDLNPYLQAAFPGAINAATRGDDAPLARLRRIAAGGPTAVKDLSGALNVITGCEDNRLPYALTAPVADRAAPADAALKALDPDDYAPWDLDTVRTAGYVDDCMAFPPLPAEPPVPQPSTAPLPAVPTLLLSGRLDIRTPLENGQAVAAQIPGSVRVTVPGTGHDELDSDLTGCAARALRLWAAGSDVGDACAGQSNEVRPFPRPPAGISAFTNVNGYPNDRGRVLGASLDTVSDARVAVLQALFAGLDPRGGGLRAGSFSLGSDDGLVLRGYSYVPGVALSGRLTIRSGELVGRVAVQAGKDRSGSLTLTPSGASGTLGGRHVSVKLASASAARVGGAPTLTARVRGLPWRTRPPLRFTTRG